MRCRSLLSGFPEEELYCPPPKGLVFPFEAVNLNAVDIKIIKIFENNVGYFLQVNQLDGSNQLKRAGRLIHQQTISLSHEPVDLGKWNRFYLDLGKLIQPDPGSIYVLKLVSGRPIHLLPVTEKKAEKTEIIQKPRRKMRKWNRKCHIGILMRHIMMIIMIMVYEITNGRKEITPVLSYYTRNRWVARNVLASDLGIIAKGG